MSHSAVIERRLPGRLIVVGLVLAWVVGTWRLAEAAQTRRSSTSSKKPTASAPRTTNTTRASTTPTSTASGASGGSDNRSSRWPTLLDAFAARLGRPLTEEEKDKIFWKAQMEYGTQIAPLNEAVRKEVGRIATAKPQKGPLGTPMPRHQVPVSAFRHSPLVEVLPVFPLQTMIGRGGDDYTAEEQRQMTGAFQRYWTQVRPYREEYLRKVSNAIGLPVDEVRKIVDDYTWRRPTR